MPLSLNTPKREDFLPIIAKLESRLEGWKARFISRAEKLQLVKTVLSAIPTYFMSCFAFPKWLIERIDKIRRQFLWSRAQSAAPIHLINWQTASLPIANGGLGIINLQLQNISLLLRWWWRLYATVRGLWSMYVTCIYGRHSPNHRPLTFSSDGSFFWKAIAKIKPIFHSAVRYHMVSGMQTSFWYDSWAGQPLAASQLGPMPRRTISVYQAKDCFHNLIPGPFTIQQSLAFDRLQSFSPTSGPDILIWNLSSSGQFSVSSIYKILSQGGKTRTRATSIWKAKVTPSMRIFFFLLLNNRLLTHDVMTKRNISHTSGCLMCPLHPPETALHLFFCCPYAVTIWDSLSTSAGYSVMNPAETPLLTFLSSIPPDIDCRKTWLVNFITATSLIWKERNARTFSNKATPPFILAPRVLQDSAIYFSHCS